MRSNSKSARLAELSSAVRGKSTARIVPSFQKSARSPDYPGKMDGRQGRILTRGGLSPRFSGWTGIGIAIIRRSRADSVSYMLKVVLLSNFSWQDLSRYVFRSSGEMAFLEGDSAMESRFEVRKRALLEECEVHHRAFFGMLFRS